MKLKNNFKIIVIEDDDAHFKLIKYAIEENNKHCLIKRFCDGESACFFFKNEKEEKSYDLILLDINVPIKNGIEVLKVIKNESVFNTIPTVILSTSRSYYDILYSYKNHANSYLIKPINFEKFKNLIHIVCEYWIEKNETL